jgi:hypothetical protein
MDAALWPDLNYAAWRETAPTLYLWTQILVKIRLKLMPTPIRSAQAFASGR